MQLKLVLNKIWRAVCIPYVWLSNLLFPTLTVDKLLKSMEFMGELHETSVTILQEKYNDLSSEFSKCLTAKNELETAQSVYIARIKDLELKLERAELERNESDLDAFEARLKQVITETKKKPKKTKK